MTGRRKDQNSDILSDATCCTADKREQRRIRLININRMRRSDLRPDLLERLNAVTVHWLAEDH